MKKVLKVFIGIILALLILWGIAFGVDFFRVSKCKLPIFIVHKDLSKLWDEEIRVESYYGLGYRVDVEYNKNIVIDGKEQIEKIDMYMFDKFITGGIVCYNTLPFDSENTVSNGNTNTSLGNDENIANQNSLKFRAIVVEFNGDSMIVEPIEQEDRNIVSNKVFINLGENNDMAYFEGQEILITYTGDIAETYPTQINLIDIDVEYSYMTKLEELPENYTLENAIEDNCVVNIHGMKIYNKDEFDRFIKNVENNVPDIVRIIGYTIEGDMIITDINFEGSNSFRVYHDSTRDEYAGRDDRIITYNRYKNLEIEEIDGYTEYYLNDLIEGNSEKIYVFSFKNDAEILN